MIVKHVDPDEDILFMTLIMTDGENLAERDPHDLIRVVELAHIDGVYFALVPGAQLNDSEFFINAGFIPDPVSMNPIHFRTIAMETFKESLAKFKIF